MYRRRILASLALGSGAMRLADAQAQPKEKASETIDYASALPSPDDLTDLLRNLKRATEQGWLMRDDFYAEDNLKRLSGGTDLRWNSQAAGRFGGQIGGFDALAEPVRHGGKTFPGLELAFVQSAEERLGDGIWTIWSLSVLGRSRPEFATIEGIFGKLWQAAKIQRTPPVRPATRPHGNEIVEYAATTPAFVWKAIFHLTADARLDYAYFRVAKLSR